MANRDFDKLSIEKQVEFINSQLGKDENLSLRKVCEKFGINRNTIGSRFKNNGYEYDVYERKYKSDIKILVVEESSNNDNSVKKLTDIKTEKYKNDTKVLVEKENINTAIEEVSAVKAEKYKSNELVFLQDIEKKKNDLLELLELKEDIKKMLQIFKLENNVIELKEVQFLISDDIKGEPVNRSVKLYDKVNKELQELYSMYSEMKKCDVLSQVIHEAYLKYKK